MKIKGRKLSANKKLNVKNILLIHIFICIFGLLELIAILSRIVSDAIFIPFNNEINYNYWAELSSPSLGKPAHLIQYIFSVILVFSCYGYFIILRDRINILENNEDTLHIFRKISTVGKTMPSEISWSKIKSGHPVILHDFGTSCFCFHSKYLDYTVWDEWSGADYRTAKALEKMIPNKNYIENISIVFGSNDGESVDLF